MAAWVCLACTTVYHVDAPACPHCGASEHIEQGEPMPKNNSTGTSHAAAGIGPDPVDELDDQADVDVDVEEAPGDSQEAAGDGDAGDATDTATGTGDATEAPTVAAGETLVRPSVTSTREAWAVYAQRAHGIDPTGMTRQALIDAVIDAEAVAE